jgi:hypothetical protein
MLLETYYAMRRFGATDIFNLPARSVDAFITLEQEMTAEIADAQKQH